MTDKKVSAEEMVNRLEELRATCRDYDERFYPDSGCPECPCGQCEHELEAIRAALLKMGEWKKSANRIMAFGKDEAKRLWELEEFARAIRDFGEEGK